MKLTHALLAAVLITPLLPQTALAQSAPNGDPTKGGAAWRSRFCYFCHGDNGEGGFGPDLAGGRGLTFEQFKHPVRKPWGVMLSYTEKQLTDESIADIYAFIKTKPPVKELGHWHWPAAPASAPYEQRVYMQVVGCSQCHEPENKFARAFLGEHAKEMNFEYFAKQIYNHTDKYPNGGMGNYSRDRLSEGDLREIYKFMVEEMGLRASIGGAISIVDQTGGNTNYKVAITNKGVKDVGLNAEGLVVFVRLPPGAKVVSGSGLGYKGVQSLQSLGLEPALQLATHPNENGAVERPKQDLSGDVVVWRIPKLAAADKMDLMFTLAGAPTPEALQAMNGSTVWWEKPGRTAFGQKLAYFDSRVPPKGDHERMATPRLPAPAAPAPGRTSN